MIPIAYLVSDFDAPSHTFVRREVAALRALGWTILPFAVRRSVAASSSAAALLGRSPFAYLAALGRLLVTRPRRFAAGWLLASRHRAPGIRALLWSQFHFVEAVLLAHLLRAGGGAAARAFCQQRRLGRDDSSRDRRPSVESHAPRHL